MNSILYISTKNGQGGGGSKKLNILWTSYMDGSQGERMLVAPWTLPGGPKGVWAQVSDNIFSYSEID